MTRIETVRTNETESADEEDMQRADAILRPERFDREADDDRRQAGAQTIAQKTAPTARHARGEVNQDGSGAQPTGWRWPTECFGHKCHVDR